MAQKIIVPGGAGYIGSQLVRHLRDAGFGVVVYDNLSTGHAASVPQDVPLVIGDIADGKLLEQTCRDHEIEAAVHLAADSLVGESMANPRKYFRNNAFKSFCMLNTLLRCGVDKLVFSSTAAVYGEPTQVPIMEDAPTVPTNPYGESKLMIERMLQHYDRAYDLRYIALRYFNAAGASDDGTVGEDHRPETHLIPLVLRTALGQQETLQVYGTDYPTRDGTCIRDYIHVSDLSDAHILALKNLLNGGDSAVYNLGNGAGYTVREVIDTARKVTGEPIAARGADRRLGDPVALVAGSERITGNLGWTPQHYRLETIIQSAWQWHKSHPMGFEDGKPEG